MREPQPDLPRRSVPAAARSAGLANRAVPGLWRHWLAAGVLSVMVPNATLAQTAPDAGQLLQQNQRGRTAEPQKKPAPVDLAQLPATLGGAQGVTVMVKSFRFRGNTLLEDAQLERVLTGYLDRKLDFKELQEVTALVGKRYIASGRLARAYLPAQDVTEGVVTIQVLEASYGGTRVEQSGQRLRPDQAREMLEQGQVQGQALSLVALDRALLLVGDLPGVRASASLVPGKAPGETAVVVNLQDKDELSGQVWLDNGGSRSTGAVRANATVALNSPTGHGEQWSAQLAQNQGSSFARLGASLPVGAWGTRLGLNGSALRYHLVGSDFEALKARGTASSVGLEVSHPLVRSRDANLALQAAFDSKHFHNQANGADISSYSAQLWTLAVVANEFDDWAGGGGTTGSLAAQFGSLDLAGSPSRALDAAGARTDGSFHKLRYEASRQQTLAGDLSGYVALQGQWANRNLDSSERFYLGGPQAVRAYPVGEAGGATGQLATLELRLRLGDGWRVTGFADWGHITTYVDAGFLGAPSPNGYSLKGAGLSANYSGPGGLDASLVWARRLGDNPMADARGRDQDGSLDRNRFWLLVSQQF